MLSCFHLCCHHRSYSRYTFQQFSLRQTERLSSSIVWLLSIKVYQPYIRKVLYLTIRFSQSEVVLHSNKKLWRTRQKTFSRIVSEYRPR